MKDTFDYLDDKKCRKGHSYERIENRYGNEIRVKWICKHCQVELK